MDRVDTKIRTHPAQVNRTSWPDTEDLQHCPGGEPRGRVLENHGGRQMAAIRNGKDFARLGGALAMAGLLSSPAFATTATSLASFEGVEEPTVRYLPPTDSFVTGDTHVNITDQGGGV